MWGFLLFVFFFDTPAASRLSMSALLVLYHLFLPTAALSRHSTVLCLVELAVAGVTDSSMCCGLLVEIVALLAPFPAAGCTASVLILCVGSGKWEGRKQSLTSENQGEKGHWGLQSFPCRLDPVGTLSHWTTSPIFLSLPSAPDALTKVLFVALLILICFTSIPIFFLKCPWYTCSHLSSGVACSSVQASRHIVLVFCIVQFLSKRLS